MNDNYGRKINYLRVSLTDKCNLKCIYCMPAEENEKEFLKSNMSYEENCNIIKAAASIGIGKIRFTGGEPLLYKDIIKLIEFTSKISSIKDISITTNGMLLYDMAEELKRAGLKRVNISLDSLNPEKFKKITRGGDVNKVFESIEKCLSIGLEPVKINTVIMRGINDDEIDDFINLTKDNPISVRFIELMPIGEGRKIYKESFISSEEVLSRYSNLIPIETDKSSTAALYKLNGAKGNIGFITPMSCKFCSDCNRIRLTSAGTLKPCLHSETEISVKEYTDKDTIILDKIKEAIYKKPSEHKIIEEGKSNSKKMMYQVGG
ncbi:cyclic pyranopterin monophosphate synthase [Clostridium homopropionicum DSM 5847]|uniref:GTP 3',8-cyclase n=1 Tax=Clostridium homopropionicum DSM 5847 TaxID=1121318 RepID=A0A0L6Z8V6_9CLOT|nr:GTP 3',8-cyclase MoaA [Clostridium homopropionicum]KOA19404.1 cyclic pyranopterin monophosphate synthase [Clostridium homopropionicum DSM 5847]SFG68755.1 cyclic pyranopterin monophosphate synthase subunit MoaA [Clostridium homopropionicum]